MKTINNNTIKKLSIGCILLILFVLSVNACSCIKQKRIEKKPIYSTWTIFRFTAGSVSAITNEEAESFINKTIEIKPEIITVFGEKYSHCVMTKEKVDAENYFDSFKIDYSAMDIKQKEVDLYTFTCKDSKNEKFYFSFINIDNELIYNREGFFFYLK
jgi:hypothetical protein